MAEDFKVEILNPRSPESMQAEIDERNGTYTKTYLMTLEEIREKFGDEAYEQVKKLKACAE